jgi:hypothetical protein
MKTFVICGVLVMALLLPTNYFIAFMVTWALLIILD